MATIISNAKVAPSAQHFADVNSTNTDIEGKGPSVSRDNLRLVVRGSETDNVQRSKDNPYLWAKNATPMRDYLGANPGSITLGDLAKIATNYSF